MIILKNLFGNMFLHQSLFVSYNFEPMIPKTDDQLKLKN